MFVSAFSGAVQYKFRYVNIYRVPFLPFQVGHLDATALAHQVLMQTDDVAIYPPSEGFPLHSSRRPNLRRQKFLLEYSSDEDESSPGEGICAGSWGVPARNDQEESDEEEKDEEKNDQEQQQSDTERVFFLSDLLYRA